MLTARRILKCYVEFYFALEKSKGKGPVDIVSVNDGNSLQKRSNMARVVVEGLHNFTYHPRVYQRMG